MSWQTYAFLIHDFVLRDNGSSLVVQKLQLISAEVRLVPVACSSTFMAGQHTWQTLLSSERRGTVLTISSNSCRQQKENGKENILSCATIGYCRRLSQSSFIDRVQTLTDLNTRCVPGCSWNRSCSRQQWQFLLQAGLLYRKQTSFVIID